MDIEAWRATVHGVVKNRMWLSDWALYITIITITIVNIFIIRNVFLWIAYEFFW